MARCSKEFYKDLNEAYERYVQMLGKANNVYLIKNERSEYFVVAWEK